MNRWDTYAKLRAVIKKAELKMKELEPELLEELKETEGTYKTAFGTFTTCTRKKWSYTDVYYEAEKAEKGKLKAMQQLQQKHKLATCEEITGLRFVRPR